MAVLVVDDDEELCDQLRQYLGIYKYSVLVAHSTQSGLEMVMRKEVMLVILDLMLPDYSGFDFLSALKKKKRIVPVIMLTARGEDEDRIAGLEHGADDYLSKPFNPRELLARIRSVIRRFPGNSHLSDHPFDDQLLTKTEREIFWLLSSAPGIVFSREQIAAHVRSFSDMSSDRRVDVHISNLRKKVISHFEIYMVYGQGYRLSPRA